jgi:hypothetical protein
MNAVVRGPDGRWLPGNPGGGRPPGSRQKIAEALLCDLAEVWKVHGRAVLERSASLKAWAAEAERQEQERLHAEAEARRIQAQRQAQQREGAERLAQRHRERNTLRAAETAAAQSQQTRDRLARLEAEAAQRRRNEAQWATVARLGDLLDPPPPPSRR